MMGSSHNSTRCPIAGTFSSYSPALLLAQRNHDPRVLINHDGSDIVGEFRLASRRILVREARWAIRPTRSSRLGGASAISFKRYSALGRTMMMMMRRRPRRARAASFRYGVFEQHAALKDQQF
jgi:hypothetical protein